MLFTLQIQRLRGKEFMLERCKKDERKKEEGKVEL